MSAAPDASGSEGSPDAAILAVLGFGEGDRVLAPGGADDTTLDAAATSMGPVLALYRAPWVGFLEDQKAGVENRAAAKWLAEWIQFHRGLLELKDRHPHRILLVNAARIGNGAPLLGHLRDLGLASEEGANYLGEVADPGDTARALQSLLAAGMASACPDAWAIYEQLESRALLLGREPEFRGGAGADLRDSSELLAGFAALRDAILSECDAIRALPPPVDRASEALRQENELLGMHLDQVLEELQFHSQAGKHMRQRLKEAGDVSEAARILISELWRREQAPG